MTDQPAIKRKSAPRAKKLSSPLEHAEQVALCQWFHLQYPSLRGRLIAIPNGGHRNKATAARLKAEGVRAGVLDMFLLVARHGYHGLWIEMKRRDGVPSDVTDEQRDFIKTAQAEGYSAHVCYGWDKASEVIRIYLGLP